jgi:hypothetical protein
MARDYAQVHHVIWQDADFTSLPAADQRLYFLLVSQSSINYAGKLDLTIARWSRYAPDTTPADVRASLDRLHARRYVLVDPDTEEALVRTFIRNDGLWSNVRMLRVAVRQAHQVQSPMLREALREELSKLPPVVIPTDPKKTTAIAEATAAQHELDEAIALLGGGDGGPGSGERQPLAQPLRQPLAQGGGDGAGAVAGDGDVAPRPPKPPKSEGGSHVSKGSAFAPPRFPDHCPDHAHVEVPPKCGGCQKQKQANKARAEALPDYRMRVIKPLCGECDERWVETASGLAKCPRCYPTEMSA